MAYIKTRTDLCGEYTLICVKHKDWLSLPKEPVTAKEAENLQTGVCLRGCVPGNFDLDMAREGILPDPFFADNVLRFRETEDMHALYVRKFSCHPSDGMQPWLVLEGVDTVADIYLNGKFAGHCENMFIRHEFLAENLCCGENEIVVHIYPSCIAARKNKVSAGNAAFKYNYETLRLRKAPHMFGWDIMPRLVSGGLFRPVYIEERQPIRFQQVYLMTTYADTTARRAGLQLFFEIQAEDTDISEFRIELSGTCGESTFFASEKVWFTAGKIYTDVANARFWWPKGYGKPDLYDVTVSLKKGDLVLDEYTFKTGLRTVRLENTGVTGGMFGEGEFCFYVNEQKIFILGTNFVPIDAFHSRDRERLPAVMDLLEDSGCNAVRCWGGNLYEDEYFYERCDGAGILVWQDFMMACAVYPTDDAFCEVLREEAVSAVRRLRSHPCILVWAGDNECDQAIHIWGTMFPGDPNRNRLTREVLQGVITFEDPTRPYIPSSPYINERAAQVPGDAHLTEQHLWGPRDYYKSGFYKNSQCIFVSEMGYQGCPSRRSMEKFLPENSLWPWNDNDDWIIHASSPEKGKSGNYAYRIELMAKQIKELFGCVPENLGDFILASQISQAEAMKFFIEMFRSDPRRTGIMWWNLIDGWPQFSDAVVDYYFEKKLAYHYIRDAQRPVILMIGEPENGGCDVLLIDSRIERSKIICRVRDYITGKLFIDTCVAAGERIAKIGRIPYSNGEKKIYALEWEENSVTNKSHYLSGNPPFDLQTYRKFLEEYYGFEIS